MIETTMNKYNLFDYDDRSIDSIFEYAKRLEGMTFNEISDEYNHSLKKFYTNPMEPQSFKVKEDTVEYKTPGENAKGQLGNVIKLRNGIFEGNTKNVLLFFL